MPTLAIPCPVLIEIEVRNVQLTKMIINNGILATTMVNYHQLRLDNISSFTIMIMENYHQCDDELYHFAKSNYLINEADTISLMKAINTIYSVGFIELLSFNYQHYRFRVH